MGAVLAGAALRADLVADPVERGPLIRRELTDPLDDRIDHVAARTDVRLCGDCGQ